MNKKLIITIIVILCVIALGVGIYFAWQKTRVILNPQPSSQGFVDGQVISGNNLIGSSSDDIATQRLSVISDNAIYDYWIFNPDYSLVVSTSSAQKIQESGVFYMGRDGIIYKVKADGADEVLASVPVENFKFLKSSSDGKRVIVKTNNTGMPKFIIYNSEDNLFESLVDKITAVDFSPDGKRIAYLLANTRDPNQSDLIIKSLIDLKQKQTTLISFYQNDFDLNWISQNKINFIPKPSAFYSTSIWAVDVVKKTLSRLAISEENLSGLIVNWSSDGKIGLRFSSSAEGRNRVLNLIDDKGDVKANIGFITLPEKCFVSDPKIYCAIPKSIPDKTSLPDDYLKNAVYFIDSIYQIDITQNSFEEIFNGNSLLIDAFNLRLVDGKLFFINKYDNKLYVLELQ